jgi:hypothetical protein
MYNNNVPQFGPPPYFQMPFPGPGFPPGPTFQPNGLPNTQLPPHLYGAYTQPQQPTIATAFTEAMLNSKELTLPKLTQDIAKDPSKFNQWVNKMIAGVIANKPTGNNIFIPTTPCHQP